MTGAVAAVVELEPGVWIAPWKGDPGRTLVVTSAKVYGSQATADRALKAARQFRPFPHARIYPRPE